MRGISYATLLVVFLVAACDSGGGTEPQPVNVAGSWSYTAPTLVYDGLSCTVEGLRLQLQQQGGAVSGTTSGGTLHCSADIAGGEREWELEPASIQNWAVFGRTVSFDIRFSEPDLAELRYTHNGTLGEGTINGKAVLDAPCCELAGDFAAIRE